MITEKLAWYIYFKLYRILLNSHSESATFFLIIMTIANPPANKSTTMMKNANAQPGVSSSIFINEINNIITGISELLAIPHSFL